jgi:hypothetical protein
VRVADDRRNLAARGGTARDQAREADEGARTVGCGEKRRLVAGRLTGEAMVAESAGRVRRARMAAVVGAEKAAGEPAIEIGDRRGELRRHRQKRQAEEEKNQYATNHARTPSAARRYNLELRIN